MCGVVVTQMKKTGPMGPFYLQFLAEKASETSHVAPWKALRGVEQSSDVFSHLDYEVFKQ